MTDYEQALDDNGKEKLCFNRKKPSSEPDSGRGGPSAATSYNRKKTQHK